MKTRNKKSRRSFIKKIAGSAVAVSGLTTLAVKAGKPMPERIEVKKYSANDKVRVAAIGMGIMGFNNCYTTIQVPGVELVAVCDIYNGHFKRAKDDFGDHLFTTRDIKKFLPKTI